MNKIVISFLVIIATILFLFLTRKTPTFHILIATAGRSSLLKLLNSLKDELDVNDAITIVFDGNNAMEKSGISSDWFNGHKSHINVIEQIPNLGYWGHGIRNKYQGILNPRCTFIMHADDDDEYIRGSFHKLRHICRDPNILYISKMIYVYKSGDSEIIPRQNIQVKLNDIGTPNGIIPTYISQTGKWGDFVGGDFSYYNLVKDFAKKVVFLDEVIYKVTKD
jgi:hypothetical protein